MLKTLFKKQFLELNTMYFINEKTGQRRKLSGIIGYIALFAFVFLSCALAFAGIGMMFSVFINTENEWLYFAIMGFVAVIASSFINMFIARSYIFNAKDNDLLLSMPIEPSKIILVRMLGLYAWGALYDAVLLLPAIIVYWIFKGISLVSVLLPLVVFVLSTVLILVLSVLLGWIAALLTQVIKSKIVAYILFAVGIVYLYYFCYFRLENVMTEIVLNPASSIAFFKNTMIPFYHMGNACAGNLVSLAIFIGIIVILFVLMYYIISRNFIAIVTRNVGEKKKDYKETSIKVSSLSSQLVKKEIKHFISCPALAINTGLGIILAPAAGIFVLLKASAIAPFVSELRNEFPMIAAFIPSVIIAATCLIQSMGSFTASSISLEGNTFWITKSMPIDYRQYLMSKIKTQMLLFTLPGIACCVLLAIALGVAVEDILFICVFVIIFTLFNACLGLFANLKSPNFTWSSETYVVKQSAPVAIAIFSGWAVVIIYGLASYFLSKYISLSTINIAFLLLLAIIIRVILSWVNAKGVEIIDNL